MKGTEQALIATTNCVSVPLRGSKRRGTSPREAFDALYETLRERGLVKPAA
ncbi:MAG: hypothetical protein V7L29_04635 [Nostoc sp.]|uniref:hypothetical protein n=1 Tax=Nostoc sp. TaxID=1180 RepID=UPI002FFB6199